jgi:drug/metabolite transporter (DMT)-like permease
LFNQWLKIARDRWLQRAVESTLGRSALTKQDKRVQTTSDCARPQGAPERRGILFMLGGTACIVCNDALIKFASQSMPLSQLMFVRACFGTIFLLAIVSYTRTPLHVASLGQVRVVARAALDVAGTLAYVVGLAYLPLANVTAVAMSSPLVITLLAILLYRERVSSTRWRAMFVGLCGVLLIVQPASNSFNAWSLLVLLSVVLIASRDMVTRAISKDISSLVLTLIATLLVVIGSGAWGLTENWRPLDWRQIGMLALASMLLSSGYIFTTISIREAPVGVVAPFKYSSLIVSSMLSYLVWDQIPNPLAWLGIALTMSAGIYLVRRR